MFGRLSNSNGGEGPHHLFSVVEPAGSLLKCSQVFSHAGINSCRLPLPQFCSLQKACKGQPHTAAGSFTGAPWCHNQSPTRMQTQHKYCAGRYVTKEWMHCRGTLRTAQDWLPSKAADVRLSTHWGSSRGLEAVKQVLTCLRKGGSLFLEILMMHSALKLKCPCLPWAAIVFMIFKLFICMQSSWPYFCHLPAQSEVGHTGVGMDTHALPTYCSGCVLLLALSLWLSLHRRYVTLSWSVKAQLVLPLIPAWDQTCLALLVLVCTYEYELARELICTFCTKIIQFNETQS